MTGREIVAIAVWYTALFSVLWLFYLVCSNVDAAVLTIAGSSTGQGSWNMSVQGDLIAANVSQIANCSRWEVIASGGMP